MSSLDFVRQCQEKVLSGINLTSEEAERLFNIPEEDLGLLAKAANNITRKVNGYIVDVEQHFPGRIPAE